MGTLYSGKHYIVLVPTVDCIKFVEYQPFEAVQELAIFKPSVETEHFTTPHVTLRTKEVYGSLSPRKTHPHDVAIDQLDGLDTDSEKTLSPLSGNNFLIRSCDQTWDYQKDEWFDVLRPPKMDRELPFNKVVSYNRKDSKRSYRDHTWIEIRSKPLADLLRPLFQGLDGFSGLKPGVDARYIYTRRAELRGRIPPPFELQMQSQDTRTAYTELLHLLGHIDDLFKEVTTQLEEMKEDDDPQISWNLLWAICAKDDFVETNDFTSGQGMAFKLKSWEYTEEYGTGKLEFEVHGEILQWTGCRYDCVNIYRTIRRYPGMRPLKNLRVKPLTLTRKAEFTERAKQYTQLIGVHHLQYRTNIMWIEQDARGCSIVEKERADGRVMVDVMSYRRFNPRRDDWDPDDFCEDASKQESWLRSLDESYPSLCTLPPTIHGWSFAAKKWGELAIDKLSSIPFDPKALDHLVLPTDDKALVRSLVEAQAGVQGVSLLKDVVEGKGCGLVLLLHGNPGTGKTLTAEAISEHLQLPLYPVSCSEFGTGLERVESKLRHILDITSLWKAVVLIDEADIFLEARCDDLERNSIVGVFLRMLEYHSGIVILTTNRVRTLDDAVKSRISLALRYKDLDSESRRVLWEKFLSFTGATLEGSENPNQVTDFSQSDIAELAKRETNGRIIKHVVRTSQALALSDQTRLSISHIRRVWKILDAFEADLNPPHTNEEAAIAVS